MENGEPGMCSARPRTRCCCACSWARGVQIILSAFATLFFAALGARAPRHAALGAIHLCGRLPLAHKVACVPQRLPSCMMPWSSCPFPAGFCRPW